MGAFISLFPSLVQICNQQHPHFPFNKIKSQVVPPCVYVVGAHVCANHNPLLSCFIIAQKIQTRKMNTRCQRNLNKFRRKHKPSGSNQAGRPEIFEQTTKPPSLEQKGLRLSLCKKNHRVWPQAQAGRPLLGRPAPTVGHPLASFRVCTVCHFYSIFLLGFVQIHLTTC